MPNFRPDTSGRRWSLIQAHLFSCAVGREGHCRQISVACVGSARSAWATLGLPQLMVCVLSWSTLLRLQVALQRKCLKRALGCMHFPGLSHSGSGSCVLHKGTDSAGPAFYALPRSEQLRRPGACRACSQVDGASFHLPGPTRLVSWVRSGSAMSCVWCVSSVGLISGCDPPGGCQPSRIPERLG